jgi:hypothetical protein
VDRQLITVDIDDYDLHMLRLPPEPQPTSVRLYPEDTPDVVAELLRFNDPTRRQQSWREECQQLINNLIRHKLPAEVHSFRVLRSEIRPWDDCTRFEIEIAIKDATLDTTIFSEPTMWL